MKHRLRLLLLRLIGLLLRCIAPAATGLVTDDLRILVLRPDHLGDVLLSRPAIDALAAALPLARLTVAVGPWGRPALGEEYGHHVLLCPFPSFSRTRLNPLRPYILLLQYAALLRRHGGFAMAVVLRPDHWWGALLVALAGIPVRVGYRGDEMSPFLTVALPATPERHVTAQALALARAAAHCTGRELPRAALALPASATDADRRRVTALLMEAGVPAGRKLVILHPGAGATIKAWPLARFAAVGAELAHALNARLAVTGSADERPRVRRLCELLPDQALDLAGALSWGELEALLARAALVVGVDTGPLHLAVATGTPSVALFGPADPAQFAPWGPAGRHRMVFADLPCRPCRNLDCCTIEPEGHGPPPCMRRITVRDVVDAALAAINHETTAFRPEETELEISDFTPVDNKLETPAFGPGSA
jgi:ADP-heptose:LPS heptosyltransferase